jgi:hypothetical protein
VQLDIDPCQAAPECGSPDDDSHFRDGTTGRPDNHPDNADHPTTEPVGQVGQWDRLPPCPTSRLGQPNGHQPLQVRQSVTVRTTLRTTVKSQLSTMANASSSVR